MLWSTSTVYLEEPFEKEKHLEEAVVRLAKPLFGDSRIYLDVKKKIGAVKQTRNIPDGYLLDLSSAKEPKLYVVENELATHHHLKHIAVQLLEFSISFEASALKVKKTVKDALVSDANALARCERYVQANGYENIDYLLETIINRKDSFSALLIIDELSEELETLIVSKLKFPVETLTIQRYTSDAGEWFYRFDPFLSGVSAQPDKGISKGQTATIDPAEIDTIVVPARDEGFEEVFVGENRWWSIRIHASMIPRIKHIAAYRVAPKSAITHIAPVEGISQWKESSKYVVNFATPAQPIGPIPLVPKGAVRAPQSPRYTSRGRLLSAKSLDEAF